MQGCGIEMVAWARVVLISGAFLLTGCAGIRAGRGIDEAAQGAGELSVSDEPRSGLGSVWFANEPDGQRLLTPLFGWDTRPSEGFFYPLTPLVGVRMGDYSGSWLFPLYYHERYRKTGRQTGGFLLWGRYWSDGRYSGSHCFPVYYYRNTGEARFGAVSDETHADYGTQWFSLPGVWHRNELRIRPALGTGGELDGVRKTWDRSCGCFPLWSCFRQETLATPAMDFRVRVLLAAYDYRHSVQRAAGEPGQWHDRRQTRVLGWLWRDERAVGESRDISVLWRLFRYSKQPDSLKLDLFFIPIWRSHE